MKWKARTPIGFAIPEPEKLEQVGGERLTSEVGTLTQRTRLWLLQGYLFARLWLVLLWDSLHFWEYNETSGSDVVDSSEPHE
jgi:hypothetical protein